MKISVIIPVYNVQNYLRSCIESVINQTYRNLEIIIVDDGSTDASGNICDEYAEKDSRIVVIHKMNGGVSAARNSGIKIATGDFLTFVDSDDTIDNGMYDLLVNLAERENADIVHCGYRHIYENETFLVNDTKEIIIQNCDEALYNLIACEKFSGSICNKLFRRNVVKEIELDESIQINEDILYCFKAFRKSNIIVFADFAMYNYLARVTESNCHTTLDIKKFKDSCIVHRYIYRDLQESKLSGIAGEQYIRALSSLYRLERKERRKKQTEKVSKEIWSVCLKERAIGKKMKLTAYLIHYCPFLYWLIYSIYDKLRKPNWEVN